jgi:hypothetical protein
MSQTMRLMICCRLPSAICRLSPHFIPSSNRFNRACSPTASSANSGHFQMRISRLSYQGNNDYNFFYYPDSPYILGDCCAEYIEERDEIICFGGRPSETDTVFAYDALAVLEFAPAPSHAAVWNCNKYPPMPHPRWSAASVLIKGLVRRGEANPCVRIFILGGRNKDGFVAEVDVFNLRYNTWEEDWKGLDQGELENYTVTGSGSGTTIIIQGGFGDGVQSVKPGEGILVTGDKKNPVVSADVLAIVEQVVNQILQNDSFKQEIINALAANNALIQNIANTIISNSAFVSNVANEIISNETIINQIVNDVVNNEYLISNIVNNIVNNQTLVTNIVTEIVQNETIVNNIVNQVVNSPTLYQHITEQVIVNQTVLHSIANHIINNESFFTEIFNEIITNETLYNQITENILINQTFVTSIANYVVNDETIVNHITNEVLESHVLVQNIVNQIVTSIVSITAPDGSIIATNNDGVLTLQAATNNVFGIVKGQSNDSPLTWHNVSAINGLLSINRLLLEALIDAKDVIVKNSINVRARDGCFVGRNEDGTIVLPFQQVNDESEVIDDGLYFINEADAES